MVGINLLKEVGWGFLFWFFLLFILWSKLENIFFKLGGCWLFCCFGFCGFELLFCCLDFFWFGLF